MSISPDALAQVPLFAHLDDVQRSRIAERFGEHVFEAGSQVTVEGRRGARVLAFFVILEGTAIVTKGDHELARLGPGDHFGEVALFLDVPRMATVTADTDLRCAAISSWDFRPLLEWDAGMAWSLLETMARRLYENQL